MKSLAWHGDIWKYMAEQICHWIVPGGGRRTTLKKLKEMGTRSGRGVDKQRERIGYVEPRLSVYNVDKALSHAGLVRFKSKPVIGAETYRFPPTCSLKLWWYYQYRFESHLHKLKPVSWWVSFTNFLLCEFFLRGVSSPFVRKSIICLCVLPLDGN